MLQLINKGNKKENHNIQSYKYHTGDKVTKAYLEKNIQQNAYVGPYTMTKVRKWNEMFW